MGRVALVWIDVALDRGHVAGYHEHNNAHLRSKGAGGFLGYLKSFSPPQKISRHFFEESARISNFVKIRTVGAGVVPCGQTDRQNKANSRYFAKAL